MVGPCLESQRPHSATVLPEGAVHPINTVTATVPVGLAPFGVAIGTPPPGLLVSPATGIAASGIQGQRFSPAAFPYQLSASVGSVPFSISGIPSSLIPSFASGTVPPTVSDTFTVNACGLSPGSYSATISFTNTSTGQGNTTRAATLTVNPATIRDCRNGGWQNFICSPGPFRPRGPGLPQASRPNAQSQSRRRQ